MLKIEFLMRIRVEDFKLLHVSEKPTCGTFFFLSHELWHWDIRLMFKDYLFAHSDRIIEHSCQVQ